MNDIAFKVIIKNDGIDDVIFKTIMLKGEKGDKGDAGGAEIDDSTTSSTKTWSSNKIRNEIDAKPDNLSELDDVDLNTITDGQMLGYNLTAGKWENKDATASSLKYDANTSIKSKIDEKANTADLATVATSGEYNDLSNKPSIPTNAEQLPITNGSATNTKAYIDGKTGSDIDWEANAGVSISTLIRHLLMTEQTELNSSINAGTATPRITYYPSTATNKPSGNSGVVITQGNGTYRQQMAIDLEGNIFARYYNNGIYQAQIQMYGLKMVVYIFTIKENILCIMLEMFCLPCQQQ